MKLLVQIGIVFGIYWVSEGISTVLPFPASVISLLLLLVLLLSGVVKLEKIQELSGFLLGNLAFFFVPAAASIVKYADVIWAQIGPFLLVCVVSLLLTYGATVWAVRLTSRLMRKGEKK